MGFGVEFFKDETEKRRAKLERPGLRTNGETLTYAK